MTALTSIVCDGELAEGLCPQQILLETTVTGEAERSAAAAGWSVKPGNRHKCPSCARAGR